MTTTNRPSQIPTMPCPPPTRAMLAAARRHDSAVSAAVLVRAPQSAPRCRPSNWRRDVRVGLAAAAFVLLPFVARAAEPTGAPTPAPTCRRVVVMQETTGHGDTTIVVRSVCTTEK